LDPNQTNDQPVQDQTGVTTPAGDQPVQAPVAPEPQVPPVSEPIVEPTVPVVPEPAVDGGNMDGDTTPPIPGV